MDDKASLERQDGDRVNPGRVGFGQRVQWVVARIEDVFGIVATVALVFMALYMGVEIVARYAFNHPFPGVWDSITLLMIWVIFLSLAYTQRVRRHIKVTVLVDRLPLNIRNRLSIASYIIAFALCAIVTWQGWGLALRSVIAREYYPGVLNLPVYPSRVALFAGMLILTLRYLIDTVAGLRRSVGERLK